MSAIKDKAEYDLECERITKHREGEFITCQEDCFCWDLDVELMKYEEKEGYQNERY